jgi:hypothetical protein
MSGPQWTPGVAGYLLSVAVSVLITALVTALEILVVGGPIQASAAFVECLVLAGLLSVPIAPVGVLLVHLACRRVEAQWVHVLAAGLAGLLSGLAFSALVDVGGSDVLAIWPLTLALGFATAVGRASVIGRVPGVRARRHPVDSDFRPEAAAR